MLMRSKNYSSGNAIEKVLVMEITYGTQHGLEKSSALKLCFEKL